MPIQLYPTFDSTQT